MKILHITNDYAGSRVYKELFESLDFLECKQIVYTAIRSSDLIDKNKIAFKKIDSKIIYRNILTKYDRINFNHKIKKITNDIRTQVDFENINLIHAHTWYSDGAVAYELAKQYKIPYVVTIRNTDMNVFYKFMIHLRGYGGCILKNAEKIFFVSDVYKNRFLKTSVFKKNRLQFTSKLEVLYNGIDQFWISNVQQRRKYSSNTIFKMIYIGKFDKGKNVPRLINSIKRLNKDEINYSLTLIGGGGKDEKNVLKGIKNCEYINYIGPIYNKNKLAEQLRGHHLFVMPSHAETFGLVYLEAISQGLPILNTINEGIYGIYDNIGESVVSFDINSIVEGIRQIKENYENYAFEPVEIVKNHLWLTLAKNYLIIYRQSSK